MEESYGYLMDPCQFGFVPHRGTSTAISLVHDICEYCASRGSPIYLSSLDAEGAFDIIPHPILFLKAADALIIHCWRLIVNWYSKMTVRIKWNHQLGPPIQVQRGTRQGGLSSPFLFNVFYQDMIAQLSSMDCGVQIAGNRFNTFCYADDVLLASTTPSGLQSLTDCCELHNQQWTLIHSHQDHLHGIWKLDCVPVPFVGH
jgi:hypothetical protein